MPVTMDTLVSFAKRRGFIFPTAEVYGGLGGFWDFGPLGVELKNNIKREWWKRFVQQRSDVVGLDSSIVTNPKVFEQSGHLVNFHDALVECKKCHQRFKADDVGKTCTNCGGKEFTKPANFNLMFKTFIGSTEESATTAYLRPETAQGIFVNFQNVQQSMRLKLPFGIGQIGKAFRNEITPGNFIFRSREFEQMELEYFCKPGEDDQWFDYWRKESMQWFLDLGMKKENIRFTDQPKAELAHYSKATTDIEYHFPFSGGAGSGPAGEKGWSELMGVANRTDFDLKAHGQTFRDEEAKGDITPFCIEPSAGVDRAALAFLIDAYDEVEGGRSTTTEANKEKEVVLRLNKHLAPIKVAILPLSKKEPLATKAKEVQSLINKDFTTWYDDTQSIGRRYRRQDEIGTPYCVTIDFETVEKDNAVTVRDRDTMEQERVLITELHSYITKQFS
ncbi:MAG: glycine--tRNA ligase [Patescibacteria group bacterium]